MKYEKPEVEQVLFTQIESMMTISGPFTGPDELPPA